MKTHIFYPHENHGISAKRPNGPVFAQVHFVVTQYLLGQGWQLVSPDALAEQIWIEIPVASQASVDEIQSQVFLRYGAILHAACRHSGSARFERAWFELAKWLQRRCLHINTDPEQCNEGVQETLIALQRKLKTAPLRYPQSFWAYAQRTLRRKFIDMNRRKKPPKELTQSCSPICQTRAPLTRVSLVSGTTPVLKGEG